MKDLLVLTADQDMQLLFQSLLPRMRPVLGTCEFSFEVFKHPQHDNGCLNHSHEFLRSFLNQFKLCLVVFDREGCGKEEKEREEIEKIVEEKLSSNGWLERCAVLAVDPELENWMWVRSPHLAAAMDWKSVETLYAWLVEQGWLRPDSMKPERPKEAFDAALKKAKTPRSSSIYQQVASKVSFKNCIDPAFLKLLAKLAEWFPAEEQPASSGS